MNYISSFLYTDMDFNPRWGAHVVRLFYRFIGFRFVWTRWEFPHILNATGLTGEGAEIGVLHGKYSVYLLRNWKGKTLHSVDPWRNFGDGDYIDINHHSDATFEDIHRQAVENLAPFGQRSKILRQASPQAAEQFADGHFDFVFIDAQHQYEGAKQDLEAWWPKVRSGGILAGHDYLDGIIPEGNFGVKSAVDEFARKRGLRICVSHEPSFRSFFIRHP